MTGQPYPSFADLAQLGRFTAEVEDNDVAVFIVDAASDAGHSIRLLDLSCHREPAKTVDSWTQSGSVILHAGRTGDWLRVSGLSASYWLQIEADIMCSPSEDDATLGLLAAWLNRPVTKRPVHLEWPSVSFMTKRQRDERIPMSHSVGRQEDRLSDQLVGTTLTANDFDDISHGRSIYAERSIRYPVSVAVSGEIVAEYVAATLPNVVGQSTGVALHCAVSRGEQGLQVVRGPALLWLLPDDPVTENWPFTQDDHRFQ